MAHARKTMTRTFTVNAMIMYIEERATEARARSFARIFNFEEGNNVWFTRDRQRALAIAVEQVYRLNPQLTGGTSL